MEALRNELESPTLLKQLNSTNYHPENVSIPLVVTYDNLLADHPNSRVLKQTLDTHNWEYAFVSISNTYRDHRDKLQGYAEMLRTLRPDKIVVLSDSRDVVCCRNVKAFMDAYDSLKSPFVVSMELFCDSTTDVVLEKRPQCIPLINYWKHHTHGVYPLRKYVNSGLIVGKAAAVLDYLKYAIDNKFVDDQEAMAVYMNTYPARVCADVDRVLLHSTTAGKSGGCYAMHVQKQDAPTYAELFGRDSFFLHFPGCNTKGQKLMYDMTKFLIEHKFNSVTLNGLYEYPDFGWRERM